MSSIIPKHVGLYFKEITYRRQRCGSGLSHVPVMLSIPCKHQFKSPLLPIQFLVNIWESSTAQGLGEMEADGRSPSPSVPLLSKTKSLRERETNTPANQSLYNCSPRGQVLGTGVKMFLRCPHPYQGAWIQVPVQLPIPTPS